MTAGSVLIAGEDHNDREAIRTLTAGLRPDLRRFEYHRAPLTLVKDLNQAKAKERAHKVIVALRARQKRGPLRALLLHEDCDAFEPAHEDKIATIERHYSTAPCSVFAVVPAPMIEAWWLLFPDALPLVRASWRAPSEYVGRDTGRLAQAKKALREAVRPKGKVPGNFPDYSENDSPAIARAIVSSGRVASPQGRSLSWAVFVEKVEAI